MPQFIFANFVQTTLSATASTTDTSLSVTSATNIPALASGQQFPLTLINAATQSVYEIVYVTEVSGTTLTVLRGQEGTIAQSWSIGDLVKGSPTVGTTSPSPGTHYPVASETLPTTLGKLSVMPGTLTADVTLTLPGSGDAGSETTIYGSAAAYTTTVSTGVTSGSPYIELPDGSQVYSYVIPASSPGAGIRIVWDGTNYRATSFGANALTPQRGCVTVYSYGAPGNGLALDPFGNRIDTSNTTTNGIQEALNYAISNNYNLHLAGSNGNLTTSYYQCTSGIYVPPAHEFSWTSDAITINFTSAVTAYGIEFDSQDGAHVDLKGQIVWGATGGNVILFNPVNDAPTDATIFITSSHFAFGQIVAQAAQAGLYLQTDTTGSQGILQSTFQTQEINGGTYGVMIPVPADGVIENNLFIVNGMHGQATSQLNVASPINLAYNRWVSASTNIVPTGVTVGASPFLFTNTYPCPIAVSVSGGTVSAINFQSGLNAAQIDLPVSANLIQLAPGNSIQVTYSAAPTISIATN